jgi:adenosylcobinamide-phosphate synthase
MSFISLLFAFLLEQVRPLASGHGLERSFQAWAEWLKNNLDAGDIKHAWTAWLIALGVPCLLVAAIHWWLMLSLGWVFAMLWSLAVLYATLGFRRFSHHFTGIRDALATGDDVLARELLRDWQGESDLLISRTEIVRHVIEHSALAAHRHVFGVVAWFSVLAALGLGPVGALFFRLAALLNSAWGDKQQSSGPPETQVSDALKSVSTMAWQRVDWLPARLTGLTFAVVGNFEDAVDAWRQGAEHFPNPNDGVVLSATAGAINVRLGGVLPDSLDAELANAQEVNPPTAGREPEFAHLRSMVGLVWRAVVMWMVLLALLTLARLVG